MIRYAFYSDKGGRDVNEDTVKIQTADGEALCVVLADGLGGHGGGDRASAAVAEYLCGHWMPGVDEQTLKNLFADASALVKSMQTIICSMKTTAVMISCQHDGVKYAYEGDSRLYSFVNGKIRWQSTDHSASQIAVMLGQIKPEEIRFHEDRSRLVRALGQDGCYADAGTIELFDGLNAFLLCSDGFWEYVYESEMEEALTASQSPDEWLAIMRRKHDERIPPNCDNNSAAAVWINN